MKRTDDEIVAAAFAQFGIVAEDAEIVAFAKWLLTEDAPAGHAFEVDRLDGKGYVPLDVATEADAREFCHANKCRYRVMARMPKFPATLTARTGQVEANHCCERHAKVIRSVLARVDIVCVFTNAPEGAQCLNCINESKLQ